MTESAFTNFFNNSQTFGLNIKVPERTIKQVGKTAGNVAGGVFEPLFTYLEENENIFNGDLTHELNKMRTNSFNIALAMDTTDEKVNGPKPRFDTMF